MSSSSKKKTSSSKSKLDASGKKANDSSYKYNTATGKLNSNYKAPSSSSSSSSSNKSSSSSSSSSSKTAQFGQYTYNVDSKGVPYGSPISSSGATTASTKPTGIQTISTTLNSGSQGDQVKELQNYLAGLGYKGSDGKPLKADGIYGPQTKTAVMQFQAQNGLAQDGIFGPKSLEKTKQITQTSEVADAQPQEDVIMTGDPVQDALLKELQTFIQKQQDAGLKINEALNFDQKTLDKFLETAKKQVHPYYQSLIDNIKQDVLREAPQILQNYESDIAGEQAQFENQLGTARENFAGSGLAFSGQRAKGELGMQASQDRSLQALSQQYGNKIYDLGRGAEEKIGEGNVNYNLGALKNYSTNLTGNGGFTLSGTTNPYSKGGYKVGSLEYDREADTEARRQALLKTASESVVAGRSYQDLFQ